MNVEAIQISKNKALLDIESIYAFLNKSYWASQRTKQEVKKSIENSICFGVYQNNKQIGFARVITDSVSFAYLADIYIIESKRGQGYSRELLNAILSDTNLSQIKNWYLVTKDAKGLYEKFDFAVYNDPEKSVMYLRKN